MGGGGQYGEEEEGFDGYVPNTIETGSFLLVATLSICVLLIGCIPCFISLGRQWKKLLLWQCWTNHTRENPNDDGGDDEENDNESVLSEPSIRIGYTSAVNAILASLAADASLCGGPDESTKNIIEEHHSSSSQQQQQNETQTMSKNQSDQNDDNCIDQDCRTDIPSVGNHSTQNEHHQPPSKNALGYDSAATSPHDSVGTCCRSLSHHWMTNYDNLLMIAAFDYESKRLLQLGFPFVAQACLKGFARAALVAIIGGLIGTESLSAYIVVDVMVGVTTEIMRGFPEALKTLCSQSLGADNKRLTGQYVQMTFILYPILYIPLFVLGNYCMVDVMLWFQFDENIAVLGKHFAMLFLLSELLNGLDETIHALLDVIECENYSSVFTVGTDCAVTIGSFIVARQPGSNLLYVGYVLIAVRALCLILNATIVWWNGWLNPFLDGIIRGFSLKNGKGLKLLLKTSFSLSAGLLVTHGEWEILTIFAAILGPAEVAAWGILGALWDALELLTEAMADAGEVRTSYLLGSGQPENARLSAYKSLYLGTIATLLVTSCLFIAGDNIPAWMSSDATVQYMIVDLMPLFGLGNIALSLGTFSWALLGAQGRYRLASAVGLAGSFLLTIPLCAISSLVFKLDLQSQTAATVIGYMVAGTVRLCILFDSDWDTLSKIVIEYNAEHGIVNSQDD